MAKKKKKAKGRKKAKPWQAPGAKARSRKGAKAPRSPRLQVLPGLGKTRHVKLDALCARLGDVRDRQNRDERQENDLKAAALKYMREEKVMAYRHAGIGLLRVPDAEKLRVVKAAEETGD